MALGEGLACALGRALRGCVRTVGGVGCHGSLGPMTLPTRRARWDARCDRCVWTVGGVGCHVSFGNMTLPTRRARWDARDVIRLDG